MPWICQTQLSPALTDVKGPTNSFYFRWISVIANREIKEKSHEGAKIVYPLQMDFRYSWVWCNFISGGVDKKGMGMGMGAKYEGIATVSGASILSNLANMDSYEIGSWFHF